MTSLSQQLKKLALPETRVFKLDKKRASFLFEAKDAAAIDRQTFFDIGCSGFDEICTIDENFNQFKQHLFNDSSLGVQRAVMSREANDDLNVILDKFLLLLTPYFTLKSAHKALEWLIYRFNIHQYNIDSVIRCILPYHDTNIFIRMLQILEFDERNELWYWLLTIRKSGKPLPRQTLLNHCSSDLGFLRFLCECTSSIVETCSEDELERLQVLFTFFTSVVCGVIGSGQKVDDGLIGQILPYVILGLRSRIQSFNIASFMIISQLSITLKLRADVCNALLKQIFSKFRSSTIEYATSTVVVLFQSQQMPSIKPKILAKLLKKLETGSLNFIDCLKTLYNATNIDNLLSSLITSSMEAIISSEVEGDFSSFLQALLAEFQLSTPVAQKVLRRLLDHFFESDTNVSSFEDAFANTCRALGRRNADALDLILSGYSRGSEEQDKSLKKFLQICDVGTEMLDLARLSLNRDNAQIDEEIVEAEEIVDSVQEKADRQILEDLWSRESLSLIDSKLWPVDDSSPAVSSLLKHFEYLFNGLAGDDESKYVPEMEDFLKVYFPNYNGLFKIGCCCLTNGSKWSYMAVPIVNLITVMMKSVKIQNIERFLTKESTALAFFVIALCNEDPCIRKDICSCLLAFGSRVQMENATGQYANFLFGLIEHIAELQLDHTQLINVIDRFIKNENNINKGIEENPRKKMKISQSSILPLFETFACFNGNVGTLSTNICGLKAFSLFHNKETLAIAVDVLSNCFHEKESEKDKYYRDRHFSQYIDLLLMEYCSENSEYIDISSKSYTVFKKMLSSITSEDCGSPVFAISTLTSLQVTDWFEILPDEVKYDLILTLFKIKQCCQKRFSSIVLEKFNMVLCKLKLDSPLIARFFTSILADSEEKIASPAEGVKRVRTNSGNSVKVLTTGCRNLSPSNRKLLLEFLQVFAANDKFEKSESLLPLLFQSVEIFISTEDKESLEFGVRVALNCIESVCLKLEGQKINAKSFDVDLLVRCLRTVTTLQSHQHIFYLLTVAVRIFKEELVVRLMPIFSFMGDNLFRLDDSHSFQLIKSTIESVTPALISVTTDKSEKYQLIVKIFRDFVASSMHFPPHRRLAVLSNLVLSSKNTSEDDIEISVTSVGSKSTNENLWIMIGLLIEYHVLNWNEISMKAKNELIERTDLRENGLSPQIEFALSLCTTEFSPEDQFHCTVNLLKYISSLPDEVKPSEVTWSENNMPKIFDLKNKSDKQLVHFKYEVLGFVANWLSNAALISKLCELSDDELNAFGSLSENLIEQIMQNLRRYSSLSQSKVNDQSSKIWRGMFHRSKLCFEKFNVLLPAGITLDVILLLLARNAYHIKQCAMEILNAKLSQNPTPFTKRHVEKLCLITHSITSWLRNDSIDKEENVLLMQSSLFTLKLLTRVVCCHEKQPFVQTLERVVALLHNWRSSNKVLLANAALCLADIVPELGVQTLSLLPTYIVDVISILKDEFFTIDNELLVVGCLTSLQKIVESLPKFLSPYLNDILRWVGVKSSEFSSSKYKNDVVSRSNHIKKYLSNLPLRVLLPAVESSLLARVGDGKFITSYQFIFDTLCDNVRQSTSDDISNLMPDLTQMFLKAIELRVILTDQDEKYDIDAAENVVLNALAALALKLSENNLKTVLQKFIDWSGNQPHDRLITLIKMALRLCDHLKGLFTLFAQPFVKMVADILPKCHVSKSADQQNLFSGDSMQSKCNVLVVDSLNLISKCCQYDNQAFMTKERFDLLLKPLVEQIDNTSLKSYVSRIDEGLVPCVANLAYAVNDDAAWKLLNYEVLIKTRSKKARVRLTALKIVESVYAKLGESISILIPETVPFIAELMEDDNEDVERQCQKIVGVLEKIVGESLKDYF